MYWILFANILFCILPLFILSFISLGSYFIVNIGKSHYLNFMWSKLLFVVFADFHSNKQEFAFLDFPCGPVVKNLPANGGDMDYVPGPGRSHMPRSD